jgi:hypothetical protein
MRDQFIKLISPINLKSFQKGKGKVILVQAVEILRAERG